MSEPIAARSPARPRFVLGAWTALWIALAIAHVTQSIWLSGFHNRPGDLSDGRFNGLVLEHGYQALRGIYPWTSPGMFYPVPHTLGYSDTHAGTLPFYAALRLGGASMERAFQLWFIGLALLNALAAWRLFRVLGLARVLDGPLIFASTAGAFLVYQAGSHMQMLPIFAALLAAAELVRWWQMHRALHLVAAMGWFAWQFAATPYGGFFSAVVAAAAALILWFVSRGRSGENENRHVVPSAPSPALRVSAWSVALVGLALAAAAAVAYRAARDAGQTRTLAEVVDLAPTWQAWLSAAVGHLWYRAGWPAHAPEGLANGMLPWLGAALALVVGWRTRAQPRGRLMFALALSAFAVALFFTQWTGRFGLWSSLAAVVEPLRAFRASTRVAVYVQLAQTTAIGLLLSAWLARARHASGFVLPAAAAVALALDSLAAHQFSTPLAVQRARADAVIAAWRAAGDRPVLAFAPGYTNQDPAAVHLDAWAAALRLHRATVNGHSGGAPGSHLAFWFNPTVANARAALGATHVDPAGVSLVEALAPADAAALHFERYPSAPVATLADSSLQPSAWTLSAPLERYTFDEVPMVQFTPPADVRFALPDSANAFAFSVAMRRGAYTGDGHSDGIGITVTLLQTDAREQLLWQEHFDPAHDPSARGLAERRIAVPPGSGRTIILRTDYGPTGDGQYDWPLFGRFRAQ